MKLKSPEELDFLRTELLEAMRGLGQQICALRTDLKHRPSHLAMILRAESFFRACLEAISAYFSPCELRFKPVLDIFRQVFRTLDYRLSCLSTLKLY